MADNEDLAAAEHANTRTPAVKTSARLQLFIVFIFQPPVLSNKPFTMASTRKTTVNGTRILQPYLNFRHPETVNLIFPTQTTSHLGRRIVNMIP